MCICPLVWLALGFMSYTYSTVDLIPSLSHVHELYFTWSSFTFTIHIKHASSVWPCFLFSSTFSSSFCHCFQGALMSPIYMHVCDCKPIDMLLLPTYMHYTMTSSLMYLLFSYTYLDMYQCANWHLFVTTYMPTSTDLFMSFSTDIFMPVLLVCSCLPPVNICSQWTYLFKCMFIYTSIYVYLTRPLWHPSSKIYLIMLCFGLDSSRNMMCLCFFWVHIRLLFS